MRHKSCNCMNCVFSVENEEIIQNIESIEGLSEHMETMLCLRYPQMTLVVKTHWCGEWSPESGYN